MRVGNELERYPYTKLSLELILKILRAPSPHSPYQIEYWSV
jgi:hypothetical protein